MSDDQKTKLTEEEKQQVRKKEILIRLNFLCKRSGIPFEQLAAHTQRLVLDAFIEGMNYWQEQYDQTLEKKVGHS